MRKRNVFQVILLLSSLAVGIVALKRVGETLLWKRQALWGVLAAWPAEAAGTIIYVDTDATGAGTGASWADAKTKLQDAFEPALSGDQVWVATGVYYPDEGSAPTDDDPLTTFTLKNGVAIYGGFAGTESTLTEREWEVNVTVLSGDIDQNDTTDSNGVVVDVADIAGTNAYHVVTGGGTNSSAVLDGFTVTAGRANGLNQTNGAGMNNASSSPTLTNLNFSGNWADGSGGGIRNYQSSPALTNVSFNGNLATGNGGGMATDGGNPILMRVSFIGNQGRMGGGGMLNISCSLNLTNVSFRGNLAEYGGGMYNESSSLQLTNVSFSGNHAGIFGGGMLNFESSATLTNTILWNNLADSSGDQIYNSSSTPVISYSDIQGSGGSSSWDTALGIDNGFNIDADPLFVTPVDPLTASTTAGDLHLQFGSPAVDTGYNPFCPVSDLDGFSRPIDGDGDGSAVCDMGAYEKLIDLFLPLILR